MVRNVLYLGLQLFNCLFKVFYICKFLFKLFLLTLNFLFKLFIFILNLGRFFLHLQEFMCELSGFKALVFHRTELMLAWKRCETF